MFLRTLLATAFALTCAAASAQTTAAGPYYAMPSWDQTLPAATRFVVLSNFNNEAVLDRETGLVWARTPLLDPSYRFSASDAYANCGAIATGGRFGWRLPTYPELASLYMSSPTNGLSLPTGHPFVVPSDGSAWTTTPDTGEPGHQFGLFINGNITSVTGLQPSSLLGAWCVRASDH